LIKTGNFKVVGFFMQLSRSIHDDYELLNAVLRKEQAAEEALYQKFSPRMLAVCYRYAKSREDAEDMLQEGFIKVFHQLSDFRKEGSLEGWIRRLMVHTCINILKRNKKFNEQVDISMAENLISPAAYIPSIIHAKQIVECIRSLPVGYRTVLNLYAIEGYSHREIATMLEIEESTSRSQYVRARALLEKILEHHDLAPEWRKKKEQHLQDTSVGHRG
jgi:RNA polymerase sigma factor (sigma-70 family)